MRALAVFQDKFDWQTAWLRRGYRHVLVAIETGDIVVVLDPANGGLHLWAGVCTLESIANHYRDINSIVVETSAFPGGFLYPTRWTCVEAVKRVLGVRGIFVLTPYQLYRRLTWVS